MRKSKMKYIRTKDGRIMNLRLWNNHNVIMFNSGNCYNRKNIVHYYEFYIKNDEVYAIPKKEDGTRLDKKYNDILVEYNVLNQADTIEELCDECISVLEDGNGSHIWHESEFEEKTPYLFHNARMFKEDDEIIYGAIWTDKGLIYVAKMNDKGELELL